MLPFFSRSPNPKPRPEAPAASEGGAAGGGAVAHPLDALTGGVFSAATSGERASRLREWLASEPSVEAMNEVFKELSRRDRGAAKPLKEKLDEIKRQKAQDQVAAEWARKAEVLLAQARLNLGDALAWQRDAARAGAPLSREPLSALRLALAERVRLLEDLQHRVQVSREAAVLLAQRIEVLSTKSWREAQHSVEVLRTDVAQWQAGAQTLMDDAQWPSLEPKFTQMLDGARAQLQLVWEAFEAALMQAVTAADDAQAPLPAVPVWADELRQARGESVTAVEVAPTAEVSPERRQQARAELEAALVLLERELSEGHGKAAPKVAAEVRAVLKAQGRWVGAELEARAHAALGRAGELEGWQRWRADQLREELVQKAEALAQAPEGQRLGGRKLQETLRGLREQWKTTDQGGPANHALWRRFDEACTTAHKQVEAWLAQVRQQAEAHKTQRVALIDEVRAWTEAHTENSDWKAQVRALHAFAERWRQAGHLGEKAFAEMQPRWKAAMQAAHARLEAAQAESIARRHALIEEARLLGAAPMLRLDAVKALQQRWQAEAHAVPLDRRQEQKLWEAFRQPIDEAFARKDHERRQQQSALSAHDQQVVDAAQALEAACAQADAAAIRQARQHLETVMSATPEPTSGVTAPVVDKASDEGGSAPRKLVAMRGDDRPGARKTEVAAATPMRGDRRDQDRGRPGRDMREPREGQGRPMRGPRLGDAAFRAQRQAVERADAALRQLTEQAHGEVLTHLLEAWSQRDPQRVPSAAQLGARVGAGVRAQWVQSLSAPAQALSDEKLLRLEMAAEVPSPADRLQARRMLQLQLLTRRNDPSPAQTWPQDVAQVLAGEHSAEAAKRLQAVLKSLMRRG